MLSAIEREMSFIETQAGGKSSRIKIPKGHLWRVRFLPVEQGESRVWWGRYIFHWINNRPHLCPKTPVEFGGLGDGSPCAVCDTSEELNRDRDQFVSRVGYKAMAMPQWLLYALVVSKDDGEREVVTKEPELWKPWEFWMTKASMADITQLYKQYRRRNRQDDTPDYSFLDLMEGTTVAVKCRKNGLRFTPERPGPIIDADRYEDTVNYIWGQIKFPDFKVPSERDLGLLARKLEEYAYEGGGNEDFERGGGANRRRRDDDDDDDDRGGARSRRDDDDDDDRGGRAAAPRRDYDEDRGGERGGERRPERREEPRRDDRRGAVPPPPAARPSAPAAGPRPAPPVSAPAPAASRPAPPSRAIPAPPARAAAPPPSRVPAPPARGPAGPAQSSVSDDEDNAPEESRDPAPPADPAAELPPVDAEGASADPAPAAPAAPTPPPPPRSLSDRLRTGIAAAAKR
jgi:hypothetical protein